MNDDRARPATRLRPRLLGPMLWYDLRRSSRRLRFFVLRFLYATAIGLIFGWFCLVWYLVGQGPVGYARQVASLAEGFSSVLLGMQFALVVLLTPLYTAGPSRKRRNRRRSNTCSPLI